MKTESPFERFVQWLKSLFPVHAGIPNNTGVVADPRPEAKKEEDYLHEERAQKAGVEDPFGNKRMTESPYPYENQNSTSECVPHSVALALGVERQIDGPGFVRLSPTFLYRLRSNYPQEGSWMQGMFDIARKYGAPLAATLPTPVLEQQANAAVLTAQMYLEAEVYRGNEYYTLESYNDIETIAKIAQSGHAVPILIYATWAEWAVKIPFVQGFLEALSAPIRHCVTVLPKSGHKDGGKRYVTVQDSAWFGGFKLRHVSEAFIKVRCYGAAYWDTVQIIGGGPRPKYVFTRNLKVGDNSEEAKKMQLLLISEGLLPIDCATGYFGGRTLAGVRAFQNKYADEILKPLGLDAPTNSWGSMCIAKANKLCA